MMDCGDLLSTSMYENVYNIFGYMDFWVFVYLDGVEAKFGQKTACPGHVNFFPNLDKKSQVLRFGRDLMAIWNIKIFGSLHIRTD